MIENILGLTQKKWAYEAQKNNEWASHVPYLKGIVEEVEEVTAEIKPDNHVYLEDELADILRDYLNILTTLEQNGYISSSQKVFDRCYDKYFERFTDKVSGIDRSITKQRQKQAREKEHTVYYKK